MDKEINFNHIPVMADECINGLNIKPDGIYIDGTTGGAGHSKLIAEKLSGGRLVAIDRDGEAVSEAMRVLEPYKKNVTVIHDNFCNIPSIIDSLSIGLIDGCLLDLGVSNYQLSSGGRGFSFARNGFLDMRMDTRQKLTAYDVINGYTEDGLTDIFYKYGEERLAGRIARNVVKGRADSPITNTSDLLKIIIGSVPAAMRENAMHRAQKIFMSVRIEVNSELEHLPISLINIIDRLKTGGRLAVISFNSLEDKITKETFNKMSGKCVCPRNFPVCRCGAYKRIEVITAKPVIPSDSELKSNDKSRSGKLRIVEKTGETNAANDRKKTFERN